MADDCDVQARYRRLEEMVVHHNLDVVWSCKRSNIIFRDAFEEYRYWLSWSPNPSVSKQLPIPDWPHLGQAIKRWRKAGVSVDLKEVEREFSRQFNSCMLLARS